MATLDNTKYTLAGIASHLDPSGRIAQIAEVLSVPLGVVADVPWVEGNLPTGHQSTIRSSLPTGNFREVNWGVAREVERAKPQVDVCAMLETYSEVDEFLMNVNGNSTAFRWQKDKAFLEGLNQTFTRSLFYANSGYSISHGAGIGSVAYTVSPLMFNGLAPRYAATSGITGDNIVKADASADGTDSSSIWIVGWGPGKVYGIYPKGTKAGLSMEDKGKQTITDFNTNDPRASTYYHEAFVTHFKWYCGLVVEDWRYVVRVCNLDASRVGTWSANSGLAKALNEAVSRIPDITSCNPVIYVNRWTETLLHNDKMLQQNIWFKPSEFGGLPVEMYRNIPIHRCDMLGTNEAAVS